MPNDIASEAKFAPTIEGVIPLHLFLAKIAKVLCSAVFLSGRDIEEARRNSAYHVLHIHHLETVLLDLFEVTLDRAAKRVTVSLRLDEGTVREIVAGYRATYAGFAADWDAEAERLRALGEVSRTARFLGDQGSVILPRDGGPLRFQPVPVRSTLPDAATQDWPLGDRTGAIGRGAIGGGAGRARRSTAPPCGRRWMRPSPIRRQRRPRSWCCIAARSLANATATGSASRRSSRAGRWGRA